MGGAFVATADDAFGVLWNPAGLPWMDQNQVMFENDEVRVLEIRIVVGETTPLHTHLAPTVLYKLSGSHFVRRDEHGATLFDSTPTPTAAAGVVQRVLPPHDREHGDDNGPIGVELKGKHPPRRQARGHERRRPDPATSSTRYRRSGVPAIAASDTGAWPARASGRRLP
jgi:hypothetical protein